MRWAAMFLLLVTSLPGATAGQERTLSGTWFLRAEAAKGETEGGGMWSRNAMNGTLDIEQKSAGLTGTWKGPQGALWPFTGRVQGNRFEFRTEARDMPVAYDGRQATVAMRWTFRGSMVREGITGTMTLHRADDEPHPLQPFTAERQRGDASTVTGVVVDARTEQSLSHVLVYVEGQRWFAETDADGAFSLELPSGRYSLKASLIGYAIGEQSIEVAEASLVRVTIRLAEGAGAFTEHVTVTGAALDESDAVPGGVSLHGRELLNLRGVTLDDPLRAVQALPSASATDDFYSEFAVRGSTFRHMGVTIDGIPSRYLMHTVHGITDGGSIAMVNSETLGAVALLPGSYPEKTGRHIGAQLDLVTREGNRDAFRARIGLSGTSATFLGEGPLAHGRGSWLVSARRSYLDALIKQIDSDASYAFGFTDAQTKLVYDVNTRHQVQFLGIVGRSDFDDDPFALGLNEEARANAAAWVSVFTWRYTPSARMTLAERFYFTGVNFSNRNRAGEALDTAGFADLAWRTDGAFAATPAALVEFGAEVQGLAGRHMRARAIDGNSQTTVLREFDERGRAAAGYVEATFKVLSKFRIAPGVRVDAWALTDQSTASPWLTAVWSIAPSTDVRLGTGQYRQFADFDQVYGIRRGDSRLRPERATHVDASLVQRLGYSASLQISLFSRSEADVLWTPDAEPRRLPDGAVQIGRGDTPWRNQLEGRARGGELIVRRESPSGLSGWAGYAYSRHRYTDVETGESFWADADQRHALSLYGSYRISSRSTIGSKFRYGSNYPIVGYIGEASSQPGASPIFDGNRFTSYRLVADRNTLRLPAYARLDVRADRTFHWSTRRLTAFVEVANVLNRTNLRNTPYDVDRTGRVSGATDALWPILPSAGFVIEF